MKTKFKMLCTSFLLLSMMVNVQAQDDAVGLTFDGDSQKFIQVDGSQHNIYTDMMPGEERVQRIVLSNENYDSMKFFVKVEQADLLNEDLENGGIVYDINFKNDGEAFYEGRIGGTQKAGKDNLQQNYLLKTLKKGESTVIDMSLMINGTSMGNEYQGSVGNLDIIFSVEHVDENQVVEIIKNIPIINQIPGVSTGDTTMLNLLSVVAIGSFAVLIILVIKKRRDEGHEKN